MKSLTVMALISCAGLLVSGAAEAQVSAKGGPILLGAKTMTINQNDHTQVLDGQVEVNQDDARLRADHMLITYAAAEAGGSFGQITTIEATGNVYYVTPDSTMKGDKAVYTKSSDTMVITGDVILKQGENTMTGNRLVSEVSNGVTNMDSNPTGANKGRVHIVVYPDKKTDAKKPATTK